MYLTFITVIKILRWCGKQSGFYVRFTYFVNATIYGKFRREIIFLCYTT